jgi:hypothetical protein
MRTRGRRAVSALSMPLRNNAPFKTRALDQDYMVDIVTSPKNQQYVTIIIRDASDSFRTTIPINVLGSAACPARVQHDL